MVLNRREVKAYLDELKRIVRLGRYRVSPRGKNEQLLIEYALSEDVIKKIILGLRVEDFCEAVFNEHPGFEHELLYVFGKTVELQSRFFGTKETVNLYIKFNKLPNMYVVVISFHKQDYPLTYRFKKN